MAEYAGDSVESIAFLPGNSPEALRGIWHLEQLRIAKNDEGYWLKGFSEEDARSVAFRSIAKLICYIHSDRQLYRPGNRVPDRKMPSDILWHPLQQALRLKLPDFNENLFELPGSLEITVAPSAEPRAEYACMVSAADLLRYVNEVPETHYHGLRYCMLEGNFALVLGGNSLPLQSKRFWCYEQLLLPVGYDFGPQFLKSILAQDLKKEHSACLFLFDGAGTYSVIEEADCVPLSRSSVKLSIPAC